MNAIAHSDQDLVRQILNGRGEAFSALVERYIQSALAIARSRLLNPADAEDAVQEAFLRAYKRLATLRDPAKFGPWFLTITRHEAARLVVKGRSTLGADPAAAPDAVANPNPSQREIHALLHDRISKLREPDREVLLLHYFAGHGTREIAEFLDLRQGAVLKRLQRAREQLAETMLRDLEATRPNSSATAKQVARITALASAVSIQQATAGTAIASAAASFAFPKAATIAAGIVGSAVTLAGIAGFAWQARDHETYAQREVASTSAPRTTAVSSADDPAKGTTGAPAAQTPASAESQPGQSPTIRTSPNTLASSTNDAPGQVELETPVSLEFQDVHLTKILASLEEQTHAHFLIDRRTVGVPGNVALDATPPAAMRPYPVDGMVPKVRIQNRPLDEALDDTLAGIGLKAVLAPGYLWISTPDQIRRDGMVYLREQYASYPGMEAYKKPITLMLDNVHLLEVVLRIRQAVETPPIVMDSRVIAPAKGPLEYPVFSGSKITDGMIRYIEIKNVRLDTALRMLARMTNTELMFRKDYVWFTSEAMARKDGITSTPPAERTAELGKILASPISIAFRDTSILEIFQFFSEIYEINISIDQRVIVWNNEPAEAVPLDGVTNASRSLSHGMIGYVHAKNLSLKSALEILTHHLTLAYAVRGDTLVISNPEIFASAGASNGSLMRLQEFASSSREKADRYEDARHKEAEQRAEARVRKQGEQIAAAAENAKSHPRLTEIRNDAGAVKAKIYAGVSETWYSPGMQFLYYRLEKIDSAAGCATLLNEKTNERSTICLEKTKR